MNNSPFVTVLTLNWNGKDDTIECVNSLLNLEYQNYEVVIIDNGSDDSSVIEFNQEFGDKVKIIRNNKNLGYGGGFNVGIASSLANKSDYTLILNNDTIVHKHFLNALVETAESSDLVGLVTGKVYFYNDRNRFQTVGRESSKRLIYGKHVGYGELDVGQYEQVKEYEFTDDVYWLVRNKVLEIIEGYDSKNFFYMGEELDFAVRARDAGYKLLYTPNSKVWHKVSASLGGLGNYKSLTYKNSHQMIFYKKHMEFKSLLLYSLYRVFLNSPYMFLKFWLNGKHKHAFGQLKGLWFGLIWDIR